MLITSPPSLHYPITVTELLKRAGDDVEKLDTLFRYSYKTRVEVAKDRLGDETEWVDQTAFAQFDSESDGKVVAWKVRQGELVKWPGIPLVEIAEPCKHEIQYGGLCVNCGKDMTQVNYNTSSLDAERATINMVHGDTQLKVSRNEATRANEEAKRRLLSTRRLTLVVDLDQTIIHATVDPTVGEWQRDPENPNHDAVKDVRAFQLIDEVPGGRSCWYYIKLRPGLLEFLEKISSVYELHIYTMGTRAYAEHIAKIVDPDRKIFGDRILSRDESGSLTVKTLHRLFPCDTNMVVIIDDRGDVWGWSHHLVKVSPYDFFVGIGDINSSFLPKRQELEKDAKKVEKLEPPPPKDEQGDSSIDPKGGVVKGADSEIAADEAAPEGEDGEGITDIERQLVAMAGGDNPKLLQEQTEEQTETITAQVEDRPLQRKQELLDKADEAATKDSESESENGDSQHRERHHLLHDDDTELLNLESVLTGIHDVFYAEYDQRTGGQAVDQNDWTPDLKYILPLMKEQVLGDAVIVFTGVIPLGTDPMNSDLGLWARSFGATISTQLTSSVTHVVASKLRRTAKVKQAARMRRVRIVTTGWLLECFSAWQKVSEEPYLIEVEPDDHSSPVRSRTANVSFDTTVDDGMLLSESEGTAGDENEDPEGDDDDFELKSPVEIDAANWEEMNGELEEFLGSEGDTTDQDDDDDDDDDDMTDIEGRNENGDLMASARKRKRATSTGDADTESDDSEADVRKSQPFATVNGMSQLQRRKRRALERVSSLSNVTNADVREASGLLSPEATVASGNEKDGRGEERGGVVEDDDDDDDGLEAELLAELQRED
ncbi:hypothetical protein P152DRAFT_463921 [Eremomyces bilateralis CBS 781.70]|uniref:RNA polymerase II subunit A C-terminal domain phosphatase n=1 Tax=Eremomyces bilateralis CBS 781.70 TaxID=1392243 RepID=A0A6G1GE44_9PEZI|nr:uncharacterized protein P152DRAFT_463921 [Eremomyces bilateralis CBS 781.70]KAF1816313.1 hypothetical protein P152DRAFT_463921 [Eremomyces bilateralis CBS 781.70]